MIASDYKTVARAASDEFVEKRSRFIGHILPVTREEQALDFIESIRKQHWDASHNVYAYLLREGNLQRYSDDGEPKGTAGIPVLDVLQKEGLTDCAVVVTRYFGGILLGGGGLVRAYSKGAKIAVDAGQRVVMQHQTLLSVTCDYAFYQKLAVLVPAMEGSVEDTSFTDQVTLRFSVPSSSMDRFHKALTESGNGRYTAQPIGEIYAPHTCN